MKKKELNEIKDKELKELVKLVGEKELEVTKTQVKITSGNMKNVKAVRNLKKSLAQIKSILNQKRKV